MRRWLLGIGLGLLILVLLAVAGFVLWALNPPQPMDAALTALQSDARVTVSPARWLEFTPTASPPTAGLIFYPGGHVDPRAYAPLARAVAVAGYYVVIVPMPLNLAVFASNRADDVLAAQPAIQHWVIGGHSLGGAMAASYVDQQPDAVDGLLLFASYPAGNNSLADQTDLAVTSIYGTRDGLASVADIEASKVNLPSQTRFVPIEGGNHAQFGWYGEQSGDTSATISREEQQQQTAEEAVQLLAAVANQ